MPGGREQLYAERETVRAHRARHRDGGEVEQVRHVGERAEPGVHTDGVEGDVGERWVQRRDRQQQGVEP